MAPPLLSTLLIFFYRKRLPVTRYAAPCFAPSVLVMNTTTEHAYGVSTEHVHSGGSSSKWEGITSVGDKVRRVQGLLFYC